MRRSTTLGGWRRDSDDAGFGVVEVLVAMIIFALVSVAIAYSVLATVRNTHDSKAREVALALAAEEIDAVRAIGDPFKVVDPPVPRTVVQGETYTITRTSSWVNEAGSDADCSASGGTLRYLRVNVRVAWSGSSRPGMAAESNTILAPVNRINTPGMGTVFVSVKGADGLGKAGISFTISPSPGSTVALEPTDAKGCSILLGVVPGTYTVTLSKPGFLDYLQVAAPSLSGVVVAGSATAYPFQYDQAASFPVRYASNAVRLPAQVPPVPATKIEFATEQQTTFVNGGGGTWTLATPVTEPATGPGTRTTPLHPYIAPSPGYQAFAGPYTAATCTVHDPTAWAPDTSVTPERVGTRAPVQSAAPGGTAPTIDVPMGLVDVVRPSGSGNNSRTYLIAVRQPDQVLPGQPTCTGALQYNFGSILTSTTAGARVALPFGSWKLYAVTATSSTTPAVGNVLSTGITLRTPGSVPVTAAGTTLGRLALDPRGVAP